MRLDDEKFFLNKSPWNRYYVILYGIAEIIDGIVRVLTLGFISTTFVVGVCRSATGDHLRKLKKARKLEEAHYIEHGDGG